MDGIILKGATHRVVGRGYLASDHISTATGLDPAFTISKNGGNFANPNAGASVMTEIQATGWYYFELAAADTDTLGPLIISGTHATMDNIEVVYQVVETVTAANVTQWEGHAVTTHSHAEGMPVVEVHYIQADVVDATAIKDAAITAAKIATDAIEAAKIKDDAITAAKIAAGAIDNATFAADVGSTAYATNVIALAVRKVLDEIKLDHLVAVADADDVADNSIIGKLASTDGDWSNFSDTTDSLQSIRDKLPANLEDMSITDTTGLVSLAATQDVNVKTITAGAIAAASLNADMDAELATIIWNAAVASYGGAGTYGQAVEDTLADTNELQVDDTPTAIAALATTLGVAGAGLTALPWNAAWDAEVQSECTDALNAYDPPTKAELDSAQAAVTVSAIANNAITAAAIATDAIDADALKADAITEIQNGLATAAALTTVDTVVDLIEDILRNKMEITDANGDLVLYADDSTTPLYSVAACVTDDLTTTTRKRLA
jgi:hypothetical protein